MGYVCTGIRPSERTLVDSIRDGKVMAVEVDRPLPDSMFVMAFEEGLMVYDTTHKPALYYKYKKTFTPDEWSAILAEANQRQAASDTIKREREQLVGQQAPGFPAEAQWLHSAPLNLADLKGNVVLLDFFADWCAPCRNDLPAVAELYRDRAKSKITVIGIHPAGSKQASIDKLVKQYQLDFPIYIDLPPDAGSETSWGKLYGQYRVKALPCSVLLDTQGKIIACGQLSDLLPLARQAATQPGIERGGIERGHK
jgi:peroxiredoxin